MSVSVNLIFALNVSYVILFDLVLLALHDIVKS